MEGNILKKLREETRKTQKQVAEELGYHTTTYARWEQELHEIKLIDAINIAKYYGVSLDYIAGLTQNPKPQNNVVIRQENNETAIGIINYNKKEGKTK